MSELAHDTIAEGLRLCKAASTVPMPNTGSDEFHAFALHAGEHYAAALRELARLRALAAAAEGLREAMRAMMEVQDCTEDCWCIEDGGPVPCEACQARNALAAYDAAKENHHA